jgi:hypothetical protein
VDFDGNHRGQQLIEHKKKEFLTQNQPFVKKTNSIHALDYKGDSNLVSILEGGYHGKNKESLAYENAIPGTMFDSASAKKIVPALKYNNPNTSSRAKNYVKFDGVDVDNPKILIDRKHNVTTYSGQIDGFRRQAECLRQNPDYILRIEVPNEVALKNAKKALLRANLDKHPQITVTIVPEG